MGHAAEPDLTAPVLWRRAAAVALDAATVFFLLWALVVVQVLWFMDDLSRSITPAPWDDRFAVTVIYSVAFAVYEVVFLRGNAGRTPGKEVLGVRVVGPDGRPPTLRSCVARTLAVAPLWLVPPVWLALGLVAATGLPALTGREARSLPDLVAGTRTAVFADDRPKQKRRSELREDAAPPTVFSLLIGRKNARRFGRDVGGRGRDDAGAA